MRKLRLLWTVALVALLIVACSGPGAVQDASLLGDDDLDAAASLPAASTSLPAIGSPSLSASGVLSGADRSPGDLLSANALEAAKSNGNARGRQDLGGFAAYVEQRGKTYAIRLVDLSDENTPERRGDYVVYKGKRAIQSVAVSRDGKTVAFIAETKAGDYDLYLLDAQRNKLSSSRTSDADERDVSMSLDGRGLAWQGGTPEAPSLVWYHDDVGGFFEFDSAAWEALFTLPLTTVQPSMGGDGFKVVFVETSGLLPTLIPLDQSPSIATVDFVAVDGVLTGLGITIQYLGAELSTPSISYTADKLMFVEVFGGTPYLSVIDFIAGTLTDILVGFVLDHPYMTADGDHATFANAGEVFLIDLVAGTLSVLSPSGKTTDSAPYWARGNFTSYTGTNDEGTFVRPGDDLPAEGRTVGYHAEAFRPLTDDYYEILSVQNYDGYLNLYVGNFNPKQPERNLVAGNDDYLGSWDDEAQIGRSRIVAELQKNKKYYIVTSACGAPGTPCGPSEGFFRNTISDGATPPPPPQPPTELPEPDNSGFNITLRFWNDSLSAAEQAVFEMASAEWSAAITGDLENIPDFSLTESQTTAGAPGVVGELDDVIIDAAKVPIDGPSGVLARAGAFYVRDGGEDDFLPIYGIMEFDEAEFGPGGFFEDLAGFSETIMHEMGHVLGISRSFWNPLGLIVGNPVDAAGNPTGECSDVAHPEFNDPRYLGPAGNEAWTNFYGADSARVPIANTGGCGTADSHWREIYLQDELMTGYAQGGGEPLSRVTIGALQDLGYVVDFTAADFWTIPPLPTLTQISPNMVEYDVEFDFTSAYTGSLPGEAQATVTSVDLQLGPDNSSTSGCEADDFTGFPVGDIALLQRGACDFGLKAANALAAGASAVLIGNQGNTEDRMAPATGTFGDPIAIIGVPISYEVMVELDALDEPVVRVDTDTSDSSTVLGPQALPSIAWHLAEELVELRGAIDADGNFTSIDD